MKKIATLLLAAGLLFSAAGMAQAIDFKIRGQWIMAFDYGEHGAFTGGNGMTGYKKGNEDNFEARQRLRLQLDAVASENLSGSVIFEMGDQIWGQSATGGALGADGTVVLAAGEYVERMDQLREQLNDAISGGNVTPAADVVVENAVEADTEAAEPSTEA